MCNLPLIKKLSTVPTNVEFVVEEIFADEDMKRFLFSLGCYEGESITVLSYNYFTFIVVIKDGKYSIDRDLANNIYVKLK